MDHVEAGRYWNRNAEAWTELARDGFDVYRDYLNTPAFLAMLPDVRGLQGLDIGCGEGHNTRLLAERGARMHAIDISPVFVRHAQESEAAQPRGISYAVASAVELPFADQSFDFATGFMSFMDVPETGCVLAEAYRVLRPGGFLQFSITHPCFDTHHRRNCRDATGRTYAIEVGDYFLDHDGKVDAWIFGAAPAERRSSLPKFQVPVFRRTLSTWINLLVQSGFVIEELGEPRPDDEMVQRQPYVQDAQVVAYFLHVRARRSAA